MAAILLATSGSGKSHFARITNGPKGLPVADGDAIVSATCGWPKDKKGRPWWKHPQADEFHRQHVRSIIDVCRTNPDIVVYWWSHLLVVVPELRASGAFSEIVGVHVPESILKRNWTAREALISQGKSGHRSREWDDYQVGWKVAGERFKALNIPTFPSFTDAALLERLSLHVSERGSM